MKYLLLRRCCQFLIIALFMAGVFVGNLSSSKLFSTIPLSDPFAALQIALASLSIDITLLTGAVIVFVLYALLGRVFCAWVCPVNLITDFAAWLRAKLGVQGRFLNLNKNLRFVLLALFLLLSFLLSMPAFESVSFIGIIQRGILFGGVSWLFVAFVILCLDIWGAPRATCSHICPLGAFYALIGKWALLKVRYNRDKCTKCMRCVQICPEKQVLWMVGKESANVCSGECLRCARCIDVCNDDALNFNLVTLGEKK
ncbi:MAG: quinol dehydrogenase ferredoxin subunit NapH [Helicobacter sp.]|nr:quinol dehydrogenase ferredoxin subunit NapH [Helicobacter sp.]MBD5167454.1 quinol dehydrogenase ferredoxin subunit NapH [Helicobacter sp.]MDE5817147.1 quinol dehydrogenase ferredoxin subunit NapH [Helicobacter sp.]MDE6044327.1 quinol dehydrogenase ferredoxin subunit NapH [Helicobacter sp.]MDE7195910.1 quinol dehydrogenase ferredoxin subunit NapH [Helicobacter sp.]